MKRILKLTTIVVPVIFLLSACATTGRSFPSTTVKSDKNTNALPPGLPPEGRKISTLQKKLVEGAYKLIGTRDKIVVRGKRFNFDCTGTVLAIYYYAGIDLTRDFSRYTGNGVLRLYKMLYERKLLYITKYPQAGDLIFWDNTYDRNHDGKWNDYLTHIGMVVAVKEDGTIEYVHDHIRKGIIIERMNLLNPNIYHKKERGKTIIVNSPMRIKTQGVSHPSKWLASQLLRAFGKAYLINFSN